MSKIPLTLAESFNSFLLGRLKLKIFENISHQKCWFPQDYEIKQYILELSRTNIEAAVLISSILSENLTGKVNNGDLGELSDVKFILDELEENPIGKPIFLEVDLDSDIIFGAWIACDILQDGGYVYTITLLGEEYFPSYILGRVEVRANKLNPNPIFSVLSKGKNDDHKYIEYNLDDFKNCDILVIALKILKYINGINWRRFIDVNNFKDLKISSDSDKYKPPSDPTFFKFLKDVYRGKLTCTQIRAPLQSIRPFDMDFCISFPLDIVEECISDIQNGIESDLLTYWKDNAFIMSDDYPVYLAYRKLKCERVPLVVMGDFPKENYHIIKKGGVELLPPALISHRPDLSLLNPELKELLLTERLSKMDKSEGLSKLYKTFFGFAKLIQDPSTQEEQLHQFILANPVSLDSYGLSLHSEVKLGKKYRVDLVVEYRLNDKHILLVELEKANLSLFTKNGRSRSHLTHAVQQVEDWLRWWQEESKNNPNEFLDTSIHPEGLVVMGRSKDLTEDERKRLLHLNSNRRVKIITYDDLLDKLESLILNLETEVR